MHYVIWDLDNCLSDDRDRLHLIDHSLSGANRWAHYHSLCHRDPPGNTDVFRARHGPMGNPHLAPVFFTARPECVRTQTSAWIAKELSPHMSQAVRELPMTLLMRPDNDARSSVELKESMLREMRSVGYAFSAAYDDRQDVVDMYAANNVPAVRLAIHDGAESAYAGERSASGRLRTPTHDQPRGSVEELGPVQGGRRPRSEPPAAKAPARPDPGELLELAAKTFTQRNALYGSSYKGFGEVMAGVFPQGLQIAPGDAAGFARLGVFVMLASKVQRYAANFATGGHEDSAHDAVVYSAMLQELTDAARS